MEVRSQRPLMAHLLTFVARARNPPFLASPHRVEGMCMARRLRSVRQEAGAGLVVRAARGSMAERARAPRPGHWFSLRAVAAPRTQSSMLPPRPKQSPDIQASDWPACKQGGRASLPCACSFSLLLARNGRWPQAACGAVKGAAASMKPNKRTHRHGLRVNVRLQGGDIVGEVGQGE